jgi:hypothetical protein
MVLNLYSQCKAAGRFSNGADEFDDVDTNWQNYYIQQLL